MNKLILITLTCVVIGNSLVANILPRRTDCIVKIVFRAANGAPFGIVESNEISEFVYSGIKYSDQLSVVGSQATQRIDENNINVYIQYRDKCHLRYSMATQVIENGVFENPFPISYGVSKEVIKPSLNTIYSKGKYWRD